MTQQPIEIKGILQPTPHFSFNGKIYYEVAVNEKCIGKTVLETK